MAENVNITLSCTVPDEEKGMAVAIMARCVSDLLSGTEKIISINLAVFGDEYLAEAEDEAEEAPDPDEIMIRLASTPGVDVDTVIKRAMENMQRLTTGMRNAARARAEETP